MSTRSVIAMKTAKGYKGIYCHNDGYLSGVGKTLFEHYQDPAKVEALINLGDISSLGERVDPIGPHSFDDRESGTTVAYGRDRGEDDTEATEAETLGGVVGAIENNGYVYVFEEGYWACNGKRIHADMLLGG